MILALAGDFLSPSVASSVFKGEQMVAALNAAGLDFATLGNHEFDFGSDVLLQRMAESKFQWVVSNVLDDEHGKADRQCARRTSSAPSALSKSASSVCA